jgi:phospholipid-binding lipoprotein MlaA
MTRYRLLLPALLLLLTGCASLPPGPRDARDPFERFNRSMYNFNNAADRAVLRPTARAWRAVVPSPVRRGLSNFVANLAYPNVILNDLLQGKIADGGRDVARLLINTVCGLGLFDPATVAGLQKHNEDFGQTLGKWGVHSGPYLVLPLLGPSTVRDAPSKLVDDYGDARHYLTDNYLRYGLWVTNAVELRAGLLDYDKVLDQAFDPYALVRNVWLQRRESLVHDGATDANSPDADAPPEEEAPPPD